MNSKVLVCVDVNVCVFVCVLYCYPLLASHVYVFVFCNWEKYKSQDYFRDFFSKNYYVCMYEIMWVWACEHITHRGKEIPWDWNLR